MYSYLAEKLPTFNTAECPNRDIETAPVGRLPLESLVPIFAFADTVILSAAGTIEKSAHITHGFVDEPSALHVYVSIQLKIPNSDNNICNLDKLISLPRY